MPILHKVNNIAMDNHQDELDRQQKELQECEARFNSMQLEMEKRQGELIEARETEGTTEGDSGHQKGFYN